MVVTELLLLFSIGRDNAAKSARYMDVICLIYVFGVSKFNGGIRMDWQMSLHHFQPRFAFEYQFWYSNWFEYRIWNILKTDCHAVAQLKDSRKQYDEKYPSFGGTGPMYWDRRKGRTQKSAHSTIIQNQETSSGRKKSSQNNRNSSGSCNNRSNSLLTTLRMSPEIPVTMTDDSMYSHPSANPTEEESESDDDSEYEEGSEKWCFWEFVMGVMDDKAGE